MYYVDYCGISELGRRLALVSKQGLKLVGATHYYSKGVVTFVLIITDKPDTE